MSGPNPPEPGASGSDLPDQPGKHSAPEEPTQVSGTDADGETEFYSQAYSAPESEQFTSGPYVPADVALYDYDDYEDDDFDRRDLSKFPGPRHNGEPDDDDDDSSKQPCHVRSPNNRIGRRPRSGHR